MAKLAARVEEARRCWNAGDLPGYLTLYDDAIRLHGYAPQPFDKAQVRQFYEMIFATLGEENGSPRLDFHEVLTDGPLYTCRFTMTGVHRGPFMGVAPTGRPYTLPGITILRFDLATRKVVERFSCADMLGLLVQLGALPPPG